MLCVYGIEKFSAKQTFLYTLVVVQVRQQSQPVDAFNAKAVAV